MSQRKVPFAHGEYYHVYNRGNSKQDLFKESRDYQRFQALLYLANSTKPFVFRDIKKDAVFLQERGGTLVHIGLYCLMPNHFHVLLTPAIDRGVETFMQKLSTGYSMYFNSKYERTGSLFEEKFKSRHSEDDRYLKYLFAYIHLNPIKLVQPDWKERGLVNLVRAHKYLDAYTYSSLRDYLELRQEGVILNKTAFPEYFRTEKAIDAELIEWLTYNSSITEALPMYT